MDTLTIIVPIFLVACSYGNSIIKDTVVYYRDCLRFCFMHFIQEDIQRVMVEWKCHRIRSSHHAVCPSGHPTELYLLLRFMVVILHIVHQHNHAK